MSTKHPIIAVTGSSGAGTTTVMKSFQHIFRREELKAQVVDLSEAGIGIRTGSAIEPGRVLVFKGAVENVENAYGVVRWSMVDEKKDMFRSGLKFL